MNKQLVCVLLATNSIVITASEQETRAQAEQAPQQQTAPETTLKRTSDQLATQAALQQTNKCQKPDTLTVPIAENGWDSDKYASLSPAYLDAYSSDDELRNKHDDLGRVRFNMAPFNDPEEWNRHLNSLDQGPDYWRGLESLNEAQ